MQSPLVFVLLLVAPLLAAAALVWRLRRRLPPRFWLLFAIGCALGATWEFGFGLLGPGETDTPLFVWIEPGGVPLDPQPVGEGGPGEWLGLLLVCLWDGALFCSGLLFVRWLLPGPHFARFDLRELAVLLAWGQLQSFIVEMVAIAAGLWGYLPQWYNPALFPFMQGHITLAPQAVWLAAYPIFHLAVLWLAPDDATASGAGSAG